MTHESTGMLPAKQVCIRYQICGRTLNRWLEDERLGFPQPMVINKRRYFLVAALEQWERERAGRKTA